ncbi:MAG: hypothetical protein Q8N47_14495 [Bryobacterales bacterium]|nr:hypothetical protein [Bryobacterales bacterium]
MVGGEGGSGGIQSHFTLPICCDDGQNPMPHPERYRKAAARLSAQRPLVIEDSEFGVASSRATGFEVVRVRSAESMARELREFLALAGKRV